MAAIPPPPEGGGILAGIIEYEPEMEYVERNSDYSYMYTLSNHQIKTNGHYNSWKGWDCDSGYYLYRGYCESISPYYAIGGYNVTNLDGTYAGFDMSNERFSSLALPENVISMSGTFQGCTFGDSVPNLPSGVLYMDSTFEDCKFDTAVPKIPDGVKTMDYTFRNASLTVAPAIPYGVDSMNQTFLGCSPLKNAPSIPSSVKYMNGTFAFSSIEKAPLLPDNIIMAIYDYQPDSFMYQYGYSSDKNNNVGLFAGCTSLKTYEGSEDPDGDFSNYPLPSGVTYWWTTFYDCESMVKAPKIPDGAIKLASTFASCSSLIESPKIPDSVKDMCGTFFLCTSLKKAPILSSSLERMGNGEFGSPTFGKCSSLEEAPVIPNSVTDITSIEGTCSDETKAALLATR